MDFNKNDLVKIIKPILTSTRDYSAQHKEPYYLNIGEIFEVTSYQPDFMEYIHVFCKKRNAQFTLPMEYVKHFKNTN